MFIRLVTVFQNITFMALDFMRENIRELFRYFLDYDWMFNFFDQSERSKLA